MTMGPVTREKVIELIDELPSEVLPEVAEYVEYLRFKANRDKTVSPPSEQALLVIVNRRLRPEEQKRLSELRQKKETGQLSDAELAELLKFVERVEREDAERAEALVELARLRGVPLRSVLDDLSIASLSNAA